MLLLCGCGAAKNKAAPQEYSFEIYYDSDLGNATCDCPDGYYEEGQAMTARATGKPDQDFLCWSVGGTFADGGTDVSHSETYDFFLTADTALYANFKSSDTAFVCYHRNDGTDEVYWDEYPLAYYLYPNTLAEFGTFVREGYTLIAYNTEPDGSGTAVNLGGVALLDTGRTIDLYCIWSKQSPAEDFTYEYSTELGGWVVTGYTGDDAQLSIPSVYKGEPVTGIAAGALTGSSMQTLVIPAGVKSVADDACDSCPNLTSLYIFDSLSYISDASFTNCPNLHSIYFNAATAPKFTIWFNYHAKKIQCLVWTYQNVEGKKLVLLGGSSTNYGINAQLLQSELIEDYYVVNMGTNGANLFALTSEFVLSYMNEGDILVQLPEFNTWQLGGTTLRWETFRSFEGIYDVFRWVDYQSFGNMLCAFCDFLTNRAEMEDRAYSDYICQNAPSGYYDIQGTLTVQCHGQTADFWSGRTWELYDGIITTQRLSVLNRQYAKLIEAGVTLWMGFPSTNVNAYAAEQTEEGYLGYMAQLDRDLIGIARISDIHDYIFDATLFFDDDYHVGYEGQTIYTEKLAADINAALASLAH